MQFTANIPPWTHKPHMCILYIYIFFQTKKKTNTNKKYVHKTTILKLCIFLKKILYLHYLYSYSLKYRVDPKQTVLYLAVTVTTRTKCPLCNLTIHSLRLYTGYFLNTISNVIYKKTAK